MMAVVNEPAGPAENDYKKSSHRRASKSKQILELQSFNKDLKDENSQLRAQLLEQQEIMTREFSRRTDVSVTRRGCGGKPLDYMAGDEDNAQSDALRLLTEASAKQHDKIAIYQAHYEEAKEELEMARAEISAMKKLRSKSSQDLMALEKEVEANHAEIDGLQMELSDALDHIEDLEDDLVDERKKIVALTQQLLATTKGMKLVPGDFNATPCHQGEDLKEELEQKTNKIESQRAELMKKIERIVQLEEEVESAYRNTSQSSALKELEQENDELRERILDLEDILSDPQYDADSAIASLKFDAEESKKETIELKQRNHVLLEIKRQQQRSLQELEQRNEILRTDLDSLSAAYEEARKQTLAGTDATEGTNSTASSCSNDEQEDSDSSDPISHEDSTASSSSNDEQENSNSSDPISHEDLDISNSSRSSSSLHQQSILFQIATDNKEAATKGGWKLTPSTTMSLETRSTFTGTSDEDLDAYSKIQKIEELESSCTTNQEIIRHLRSEVEKVNSCNQAAFLDKTQIENLLHANHECASELEALRRDHD